jgi:hypothetical protein
LHPVDASAHTIKLLEPDLDLDPDLATDPPPPSLVEKRVSNTDAVSAVRGMTHVNS